LKSFNWEEKESKVKPVLPAWRKEESEPPKKPYNFYAKDIVTRIENGKEDFTSTYVSKLYTDVANRLNNLKSDQSTSETLAGENLRSLAHRPKLKPRRKQNFKKIPNQQDKNQTK